MIKIGILGDIGSGKSHIAKKFGYPVFNADTEVGKLYKKNRKIFNRLKKVLPEHIHSFPINKKEICDAILANKANLKKNYYNRSLRNKKKNEYISKRKYEEKNCSFGYSSFVRK